jgi:hypothetical protein
MITVPSRSRLSGVGFILLATPCLLAAQSLHGSTASINRMYREARSEDFSFFETSASVRRAVKAGLLVRLDANADDFALSDIGYPYVRPATLTFVQRLADQYRAACGEPLVVTSAVRPATRQPPNSTARSVHPTGMAVDLRRPEDAGCRSWLRDILLDLEKRGLVEATEEHTPAHFHVAVFSTPYEKYVAARVASVALATYVVRPGDTLSEIAHDHDVSITALVRANALDDDLIVPGQELRIPNG